MDKFFNAQSVAIIGVSANEKKVGHTIYKNLLQNGYKGKIYPVNPNIKKVLGETVYPTLNDIPDSIDLAVIAIPAKLVLNILDECGKKKIKHVIIISSGFKETGNFELEKKLKDKLKEHEIKAIGPNCLGTFDAYSNLDLLFLPREKMQRPEKGVISFISQSGALGAAMLDKASSLGYGFSKFISYGNATSLNESDCLEYLEKDRNTKVICLYIEGVSDAKRFMEVAKNVAEKKPVIVIKGGATMEGSKATLSHTGSLAGQHHVYNAAFKQTGLIQVETLEELFLVAKLFEKGRVPKGLNVQVITNGGGYGILCTDAIVKNGLKLAQIKDSTKNKLKKLLPDITTIGNPIDLVGDADPKRYEHALIAVSKDKNIDIILLVALLQTPTLNNKIVDVIKDNVKTKTIVVVSTGGNQTQELKNKLEQNSIPTFDYPEQAVFALKKFSNFYL
ncbi:MAG: CoA-binding protein [archaeon]